MFLGDQLLSISRKARGLATVGVEVEVSEDNGKVAVSREKTEECFRSQDISRGAKYDNDNNVDTAWKSQG